MREAVAMFAPNVLKSVLYQFEGMVMSMSICEVWMYVLNIFTKSELQQ